MDSFTRIRFIWINYTMTSIYDVCDDLYEALADEDFGAALDLLDSIHEQTEDVRDTVLSQLGINPKDAS